MRLSSTPSVRAMISFCRVLPIPVKSALYPATRMNRPRYCSGFFWASRRVRASETLNCSWLPPMATKERIKATIFARDSGLANSDGLSCRVEIVPPTNRE